MPSGTVFKRDIFSKIGYYNLDYALLSDYDFTLRAFSNPNSRTYYVDEVICVFDDTGRTSNNLDIKFYKDRHKNFTKRFKCALLKKGIVVAFEPYFYTVKKGNILKALFLSLEMFVNSGRINYPLTFFKLTKDRFIDLWR